VSGSGIKTTLLTTVIAIAAAFSIALLLLWITGFDPAESLVRLIMTTFGSRYSLAQTAQQTVPILLCSIGIAFAARLGLWNIGAEGQFYMGALATVAVFQYFPTLPSYLILPAMAVAGIIAGALWMLIPALLRAYGGVSEILTTLMMNYVAVPLMNYFLYGPWKSPTAFNFPVTNRFTANAFMPILPGFPVHIGFVFAIAIAAAMDFMLWHTSFGFRVKATGNNRAAAVYAGYPVQLMDVIVLCLSGALAGFAGMIQVTGVTHQLLPSISPGYGYLAIIVASLALISIRGCVAVSILLAIILVGSKGMETTGVPSGIANFLSGLLLLFALIGVAISSRGQAFGFGRSKIDVSERSDVNA
jgi:general nucleoside transport system permease protein